MKRDITLRRACGFALIEALIAMAILGIGILALAKFNTFLIETGAQSKSRAEAAAYANEKLAQLRNLLDEGNYDAIAGGTDTITAVAGSGSNANFTRTWTVQDTGTTDAPRKKVTVTVSWADRFSHQQQVVSQTAIAWLDPSLGFLFTKAGEDSLAGKFATAPTGKATLGHGTTTDNGTTQTDAFSGLKTQEKDGNLLLYDASGNVLLTMGMYDTSGNSITSGTAVGFSTVEGYIYNSTNKSLDNVQAIVSDAAYCWKGSVSTYTYMVGTQSYSIQREPYKCWLGIEWYGNIALVWTASSAGPSACVGDPTDTNAYTSYSNSGIVAASGARHYRGYKLLTGTAVVPGTTSPTTNIYQSTGIGVTYNDLGQKEYTQRAYTQQNFFLATLNGGGSNDTKCKTAMQAYGSTSPNPFIHSITYRNPTDSSYLYTDDGLYVCLSSDWSPTPSYCPNAWPATSSSTLDAVIVHGTITQELNPSTSLVSGITSTGSAAFSCTLGTYDVGHNTQSYTCQANLAGYISSVWDAVFTPTLNGSAVLCANGASGSGVVDAGAGTITFSNQTVSTVTQAQNFTVADTAANCP